MAVRVARRLSGSERGSFYGNQDKRLFPGIAGSPACVAGFRSQMLTIASGNHWTQALRRWERLLPINPYFSETARWKRCIPRGFGMSLSGYDITKWTKSS